MQLGGTGSRLTYGALVQLPADAGRLTEDAMIVEALPPRARNSHKGLFGDAVILGGAPGMVGAALLAGRAALKLGADLPVAAQPAR